MDNRFIPVVLYNTARLKKPINLSANIGINVMPGATEAAAIAGTLIPTNPLGPSPGTNKMDCHRADSGWWDKCEYWLCHDIDSGQTLWLQNCSGSWSWSVITE